MNSKTGSRRLHKVFSGWLAAAILAGGALAVAEVVPPGTADEIRARTQPVGSLCRVGEACAGPGATAGDGATSTGLSGEQVYNQFCFACHATGVSGAPLLADAGAWEPRIAKGIDVLMANTLNGINVMPPKGTCMNCSEAELQAAVDYMLGAPAP